MGFLSPNVPKPMPAANPAINPKSDKSLLSGSFLSPAVSGPAGLKRKNELGKTSLIGGG
jgi:hypothetical protein